MEKKRISPEEVARFFELSKQLNEEFNEAKNEEMSELFTNRNWNDIEIEENGKKGLKDVTGKIVVPAIYEDCFPQNYHDYKKYAPACKDGKWGLVTRDGKGTPVSEFAYHTVQPIPMTPFFLTKKGKDEPFAIMYKGEVMTPFELERYYEPCNGTLTVEANGKTGILLFDDELIYIPPIYDDINYLDMGSELVVTKNGEKGYLTYSQEFIPLTKYEKMTEEEQDDLFNKIIFVPDVI